MSVNNINGSEKNSHIRHRGAHSGDSRLFAPKAIENMRQAVADVSYLLSRGYPDRSTNKLVSAHFKFNNRQRMAVNRAACSDHSLALRRKNATCDAFLKGKTVYIDGFNQLITMESLLSGGYVFVGRDGALRDLAGVHGSYRRVYETIPAIELIGNALQKLEVANVIWLLDTPVSNSIRLKGRLNEVASAQHWNWDVRLVQNPDKMLKNVNGVVVTTDAMVLNVAQYWYNLVHYIYWNMNQRANIVNLNPAETDWSVAGK